MVDAPSVYSQTMRPVPGSTAEIPLPDCNATVVFCSPTPFKTTGEVQLAILGRANLQRLIPVRTLRPTVKDSLSFSSMTTRTPSATAREEDIPRLLLALG